MTTSGKGQSLILYYSAITICFSFKSIIFTMDDYMYILMYNCVLTSLQCYLTMFLGHLFARVLNSRKLENVKENLTQAQLMHGRDKI